MERRSRRALVAAAVGVALATSALASPREVYDRHGGSVVAVTYFIETHIMRQVREIEGREIGVLVASDLVMFNGDAVTSSTTGSQPHTFRVHFANGAELTATYVGRDEFANLAFVRLEAPLPKGVRPLEFEARPKLRVGDEVNVLGLLPENLEPMVRVHTGRVVAHVRKPKPFFVTDIPTEDALGAPVFTARGKAVGILTELGGSGPAFAQGLGGSEVAYYGIILTAETLQPLIDDPPLKGESRRAWLGITLQALTPDMAEYWGLRERSGIVVNSVIEGSPAHAAGLQVGDVIVRLDGMPIPVTREDHVPIFVELVGSSGVGAELDLGVVRDGEPRELQVTLVGAPKSRLDAEQYRSPEFELTVRELVFADYRFFDLEPEFKGVLVSRVEEGGWAGVGGVQSGDIVQRVDDRIIATPDDMKAVLAAAVQKEKRKLVFFVRRSGRTQFITIQPNWDGQS